MFEVGAAVAGTALLTSGVSEQTAEARRPPPPIEPQTSLVSLQIESPDGGDFPSFRHGADIWIAGFQGERYNLRLQNHSPERVEVVVSVDGRDVVSGRLGDYAKQRGYVLDPFGVLSIEGYRQSLDSVAAFRFADLPDSYAARMGTPANVGVIGVAVFAEKSHKRRHDLPLAPVDGDPFPGEDAGAPAAAPRSSVVSGSDKARRKAESRGEGADMSWAAPEQPSQLGTEYGESTFAPVEEVSFKRKHSKKPDQLIVVRYDSMEGLRARGIIFDDVHREPLRTWDREPPRPQPREFAPPPPPRDWWR
jgi:hypothetical protein